MNRTIRQRPGFTLIELIVVMAIIAFLAAVVMLAAPSIMDQDRARDAATQLQGALQNARMRAMRDGMPRGVRLLIDQTTGPAQVANQNNPSPNIFFTASSYQYIEVPPWFIPSNATGATPTNGIQPPYLQINYTPNPKPATINKITYPAGSVGSNQAATARSCTIGGLSSAQLTQLYYMVNGPLAYTSPVIIGIPTLSVWSQIVPGSFSPNPLPNPIPATLNSCTVNLSVYPDAPLGAATSWATYGNYYAPAYFGIYQSPRPLLGEPVMQMPVNSTVDLSDGVSQPSYAGLVNSISTESQISFASVASNLQGYDILFSPSGQMMMPYGYGQVYLWVRDATKGIATPGVGNSPTGNPFCSICPSASTLGSYPVSQYSTAYSTGSTAGQPYNTALTQGGEQLLITIKGSSGGTGITPVFWGTTTAPSPYVNAINAANTP